MKYLSLLLLICSLNAFAQNIDFNTKDGFIAKGYDVVAYFDDEAKEGLDTFTTTYKGIKFKFSSKLNQDTFIKNPEKYIPQYGAYCAYAIAENAKKVDINPKTFEVREGKLYLFYNSWGNNTLKKWLKKDVKGLQEKADLNWEVVKFN